MPCMELGARSQPRALGGSGMTVMEGLGAVATIETVLLIIPRCKKEKVTLLCPTVCDPVDCPWNSPGQNTRVGNLSLLQGIFPTQGSNPGLPHCRQILYYPSPQGSPRNTGVGSLSLCQRIFLTQESNRGLLHCRQILYQLSYQGISIFPRGSLVKYGRCMSRPPPPSCSLKHW